MICKKFDDGCDNGVGRCVEESQHAGTTFFITRWLYIEDCWKILLGYDLDPTKAWLALTFFRHLYAAEGWRAM